MDAQSLKRQNNILHQRVLFLESQLVHMKTTEAALVSKVQQINTSRTLLVERLDSLAKQYDDKLRLLENKIQKITRHNQILVKQGNQYKEEIALFQNRIIEKQRLLTTFVIQEYGRSTLFQPEIVHDQPLIEREKIKSKETKQAFDVQIQTFEGVERQEPPPPHSTLKTIPEQIDSAPIQKPTQNGHQTDLFEAKINSQSYQNVYGKQKQIVQKTIEPVEPVHNIQESENFFNQLASNSFVSQIVAVDDNPIAPDTPFSHHFGNNNFQESQFSESQNFFDTLAQGNQFSYNSQIHSSDLSPFKLQTNNPVQIQTQGQNQGNGNVQVSDMMAPPKFVQPKKHKRDRLQVMNSNAFQ